MGHETTSARTVNHTALSLASSFRIASGTSSPSFVDTRSGECGAGPACDAGVDGSQGFACLSCLPSRFWCAHNKHNAARQQNPAMHAMIIPWMRCVFSNVIPALRRCASSVRVRRTVASRCGYLACQSARMAKCECDLQAKNLSEKKANFFKNARERAQAYAGAEATTANSERALRGSLSPRAAPAARRRRLQVGVYWGGGQHAIAATPRKPTADGR